MSDSANQPPRPGAIEVHIETLVVDGLTVSNPGYLGAVVQNRLQTLLAENGLGKIAQVGASGPQNKFASLRAPVIHTPRSTRASDAGEKIARAIHGGLHG